MPIIIIRRKLFTDTALSIAGFMSETDLAGGRDRVFGYKDFKDYPNIYVDVSGSNNEEKLIDLCIEYLGEDRISFGADSSYYHAVGKILASNTTESQRKKSFLKITITF